MGLGTRLGHQLLKQLVAPGQRRFDSHLGELEATQRAYLSCWLAAVARAPEGQRRGVRADWSYEDFARQLPLSTYKDYAELITRQREQKTSLLIDSPVMRYQPTSGSTSAVKWVPYTQMFLDELDQVITAWVGDLYHQYPKQAQGTHYWSLSWIPTELRGQTAGDINDDMKMLSFGKRLLAYLTQAAPQDIALAETSDDSLFATIAYLAADPLLGFISVWSPTFGLGLLEQMSHWRAELAECLQRGHWGERTRRMAALPTFRPRRTAAEPLGWAAAGQLLRAAVAAAGRGQRLGHGRSHALGCQAQGPAAARGLSGQRPVGHRRRGDLPVQRPLPAGLQHAFL